MGFNMPAMRYRSGTPHHGGYKSGQRDQLLPEHRVFGAFALQLFTLNRRPTTHEPRRMSCCRGRPRLLNNIVCMYACMYVCIYICICICNKQTNKYTNAILVLYIYNVYTTVCTRQDNIVWFNTTWYNIVQYNAIQYNVILYRRVYIMI